MLIGLLVCIGLVVKQYCLQQTIFQLDYSGKITSFDNCPSISICFVEEEVNLMFRQAMQNILSEKEFEDFMRKNKDSHRHLWFFKGINKFYEKVTDKFTVIEQTIPNSSLEWSSHIAISKFPSIMHNFTVKFTISPNSEHFPFKINVKEQVPNLRRFLCTTFEFENDNPDHSWGNININVENELDTFYQSSNSTMKHVKEHLKSYEVIFIIHDKGLLPFSAYDQHITESIPGGIKRTLFLSKSITRRLNTKRNPCQDSRKISLFGHEYGYSHHSCGWYICCTNMPKFCNCSCELDVLGHSIKPCAIGCQEKVCLAQVSYEICPNSCTLAKYTKYNIYNENIPSHINKLVIVKSDNVHIATEEELYTLTKLCSEIGGLCSLFIGFSCIFLFEIIEAIIIWQSSASINESSTLFLTKSLDVSNSPQMNHFLSPRYYSNCPSSNDINEIQNFSCSRTIVLILVTDNMKHVEYHFHGEREVDKLLLHEQLRLGRVKIKLL